MFSRKGAYKGLAQKSYIVDEINSMMEEAKPKIKKVVQLDDYRGPKDTLKAKAYNQKLIESINSHLGLKLDKYNNYEIAKALNIPDHYWIIDLHAYIFERLGADDQILWANRFYLYMPEGADLSSVRKEFNDWYSPDHEAIDMASKILYLLDHCKVFKKDKWGLSYAVTKYIPKIPKWLSKLYAVGLRNIMIEIMMALWLVLVVILSVKFIYGVIRLFWFMLTFHST